MAERANGAGAQGLGQKVWWSRSELWLGLIIIWLATLFWLSSRPGVPHEQSIPHFDKIMHFGYFGLGGLILQMWLRSGRRQYSVVMMWGLGVVFALLVGLSDEVHQTFTPGRSGNDPWDLLADVVGGCAAGWLMRKVRFSGTSVVS